MDIILIPLFKVIIGVLNFYQIVIFVSIIMSWLFLFGIIDASRHPFLANIYMIAKLFTEPLFSFVRRFVPPLGALDLSPIVVILAIYIIDEILLRLIFKLSVVY